MKQSDIPHKLRLIHDNLKEVSDAMIEHAMDDFWIMHAGQLAGAARLTAEWADEIEKEIQP